MGLALQQQQQQAASAALGGATAAGAPAAAGRMEEQGWSPLPEAKLLQPGMELEPDLLELLEEATLPRWHSPWIYFAVAALILLEYFIRRVFGKLV